jgi:hypothetical protein
MYRVNGFYHELHGILGLVIVVVVDLILLPSAEQA